MDHSLVQRRYRSRRLEVRVKDRSNPVMWKIGLLLAVVLVAGVFYVWLISSNERLDRQLHNRQKQLADGMKQLENVRMELESYKSGHYIITQVQNLNLNLHPPYPGQVRRVSLEGRQNRADYSEDGLLPLLPQDVAQRTAPGGDDVVYP